MKTSNEMVKQIALWEGFRSRAYSCPAGILTIGFGHTRGVKPGDVCSREEALQWLAKDLSEHEGYVNKFFKGVSLTQNQFDAAVSFCYNAGPGNMQKSTWAGLLKQGQVSAAAASLKKWGEKQFAKMPGLRARRAAEAALLGAPDEHA